MSNGVPEGSSHNYPAMDSPNSAAQKVVVVQQYGQFGKIIDWVLGQPANTAALYIIIGLIIYGGYMLVRVGIPMHLNIINQGWMEEGKKNREANEKNSLDNRESHKRIADKYTKSMEAMFQQQQKDIDSVIKGFDRAIDHIEKSFAEGFNAAAKSNNPKD